MNLSGLITVQPDQTEELDALATMVGRPATESQKDAL